MERYAELTKERLLNIAARVNEASVPKKFVFTNSDGTPHPITSYGFEIPVKKIQGATTNVFKLTIGDGLTITGDDENELLVEVSRLRATVRSTVYFWTLFASTEGHTWLNGDWNFFNGKYDGNLLNCTDMSMCGDVQITIESPSTAGLVPFGGLWNFADNTGDFPTAASIGALYIAEDDHGALGDADYVPAGAWMVATVAGADEFDEYSIKF